MAIIHNYLETTGYKPTAAEAEKAELIPNLADGTLWTENGSGTVIQIGGGTYNGGTGITISDSDINHDSHTGEVTGSTALTIANGVVTLAKMADISTDIFIGRTTIGVGVPEELSKAAALAILGVEDGAEVNNISDVNATDLTDGNDSTLHYHASDRSRANHTGTQTLSTISDAGTAAAADTGVGTGDVPVLDGDGWIPSTMMPPLSLTDVYSVATEVAQLALTVQEGDVAVRTDESKSYIALNADNVNMADWQELLTPTGSGTNLAVGTKTATTLQVTSSTGNNVDLPEANTTEAGLLGSDKWDEIVANSSKDTNVSTELSNGTINATTYGITSDGGTDDVVLASATTSLAGVMPAADKTKSNYISITQAVDLDDIESNQVGSLLTGEAV